MSQPVAEQVHEEVRRHYGQIAEQFDPATSASCCGGDGCCESPETTYELDTSALPVDVTGLSLGCGDPITLAALEPGQRVLDLGSGGGIDCFLAARQVGPTGYVIGVDMTPVMLEKSRRNQLKVGLENVEFRQGQIEELPVDSDSVDVVISNCVINLSPDKAAVFREAFRVLRPGGRVAVSDMVTQGRYSPQERADMASWSACVSGAEDIGDYVGYMCAAGFTAISVRDKAAPEYELAESSDLPMGAPRLFSARVTAVKPA
jgi:SAM-dependent methyltransferase